MSGEEMSEMGGGPWDCVLLVTNSWTCTNDCGSVSCEVLGSERAGAAVEGDMF